MRNLITNTTSIVFPKNSALLCLLLLALVSSFNLTNSLAYQKSDLNEESDIFNNNNAPITEQPSQSQLQSSIDSSQSQPEQHKMHTRSGGRRYCGTSLVRVLALVCDNTYNKRDPNSIKRFNRDSAIRGNAMIESEENDEPNSESRFSFSKLNESNGSKYFHRKIRGVVDECCKNACTISTLSTYCSSDLK